MIANNEKPRRSFYLLWILLTLLCVPIAFFLDLIILRIIILLVGDLIYVDGVRHITEDYLSMYIVDPDVRVSGKFRAANSDGEPGDAVDQSWHGHTFGVSRTSVD